MTRTVQHSVYVKFAGMRDMRAIVSTQHNSTCRSTASLMTCIQHMLLIDWVTLGYEQMVLSFWFKRLLTHRSRYIPFFGRWRVMDHHVNTLRRNKCLPRVFILFTGNNIVLCDVGVLTLRRLIKQQLDDRHKHSQNIWRRRDVTTITCCIENLAEIFTIFAVVENDNFLYCVCCHNVSRDGAQHVACCVDLYHVESSAMTQLYGHIRLSKQQIWNGIPRRWRHKCRRLSTNNSRYFILSDLLVGCKSRQDTRNWFCEKC